MFRDLKNFIVDLVIGIWGGSKTEEKKEEESLCIFRALCIFRVGEIVKVDPRTDYVAKRYWNRKGKVESIIKLGDQHSLGLKILDRKTLLWVLEEDLSKVEDK